LVSLCEARRKTWLLRWKSLGGIVGIKEWDYKREDSAEKGVEKELVQVTNHLAPMMSEQGTIEVPTTDQTVNQTIEVPTTEQTANQTIEIPATEKTANQITAAEQTANQTTEVPETETPDQVTEAQASGQNIDQAGDAAIGIAVSSDDQKNGDAIHGHANGQAPESAVGAGDC